MFYSTVLLAAAAFTGMVAAQQTVDPNSIAPTTRQAWCRAETNTCPILCGNSINMNTCDSMTLNFTCSCHDGTTPDLSKYINTIPQFMCQAYIGQCLENNAGNATAQDACQEVQCGSSTASAVASKTSSAVSSSSSAAATTSDSGASATTSASETAASQTGAASALNVGKEYGVTVLAAGVFGLFAYAL